MTCDAQCCDFCRFYDFGADENGAYQDEGNCCHPEHPKASDPGDFCPDFECEVCA